MKVLLDTHAFLWFVDGDRRLSAAARTALERDDAEPCLSVASVWEMAIKSSRGRLSLSGPFEAYFAEKTAAGLRTLAIDLQHVVAVEQLPFHHADPFDRLLIAQALTERIPVITRDRVFRKYGVDVIW